ncbi:hypothetical protein [Streptomyces huasconensis]|uniref:hypothetical protein n=1 Tax=Streptomyces huasconensis TaxID=1854574 RepID=UPI0036FE6B0E
MDEPAQGMRTTAYRVIKGAWGIAVDLTAEVTLGVAPPVCAERVSPCVWLDAFPVLSHPPADRTGCRITPEEAVWLRHGVALAAPAVEVLTAPRHTTITVHRVRFPETDYQPEGLAAAVLAWTEAEFGLPPRPVEVRFDRSANRYVYGW